ncbi:MAG: ABC-F family ATP-binding cassette domain-containing protein [Clostridia bacterium]|nr:ABC-F family ATP-binding cassette domain-containing protein [Clostridia bacterium]
MQWRIQNGAVDLSGEPILRKIDFEINDNSKIAVVGRNGCGKTTLMKLIAGCLSPNEKPCLTVAGKPKIAMLDQMTFEDDRRTLVEEIRSAYGELLALQNELENASREMESAQTEENILTYTTLLDRFEHAGGFTFQKEYEGALRHFGFSEEEKQKRLSAFSGGQRTKIALLKLVLLKPDILLLDEPTNHLDIEATEWLETYLKTYKKAFVVVSHDRMFLDRVATEVYEIEHGKTERYAGNYTQFIEEKKKRSEQREKEYQAQKKETERLERLVERFHAKATKASMAQSKEKQLERMGPLKKPDSADNRTFHADLQPDDAGVKDVLSIENLCIGYTHPLATVNLEIKRGDRIGIIGGNGLGKSTLIRTLTGEIPPLSGRAVFGPRVTVGYFDQQMARVVGHETVLDNYLTAFPDTVASEARSALAAFLFRGEDVFKTVDMLSGGERVRLSLCKIFRRRPNFLILDEPTNHMDIIGKETLEDILSAYTGTILLGSHDRYLIRKLAQKLLCFDKEGVKVFPYGYEQYLEEKQSAGQPEAAVLEERPKQKKTFTTPAKEKAKKERAIAKAEETVALLEEKLGGLQAELQDEENLSDYLKLSALQQEIEACEIELDAALGRWEELSGA